MFYGRSEVSDPGQEECGILNEEQLGNQIVPIQFAIFRRGHSKIPVTIITQDHLHSIIQSMVKGMMSRVKGVMSRVKGKRCLKINEAELSCSQPLDPGER